MSKPRSVVAQFHHLEAYQSFPGVQPITCCDVAMEAHAEIGQYNVFKSLLQCKKCGRKQYDIPKEVWDKDVTTNPQNG